MFLLEKNNRGFVSPEKSDAIFELAQMEIFENLFFQYNKWLTNKAKRLTGAEYANIPENIREQIDAFAEYSTDSNFVYDETNEVWHYTGSDLYRTEGLSLVNAQSKKVDVEKVNKGYELNNLINSTINPPTTTFPIYTQQGSGYKVYPEVPDGYTLELFYIRTPKTPKWTYVIVQGNPVYNAGASDKQDIELDESLFVPFIIKVMAYFGISIKEQDVATAAANAEMVNEQKQS